MIVIEFKPSRLLPVILIGVHAAAAFSFFLGFGWDWPVALALGVFGVSLARSFVLVRRGPRRLGLVADGKLLLEPGEAQELSAVVQPSTVVLNGAVWLAWSEEGGRRRGVVVLLRDQLLPGEWRELQVWVRLRARPQAAGSESGGA